jgi:hypothetical protein
MKKYSIKELEKTDIEILLEYIEELDLYEYYKLIQKKYTEDKKRVFISRLDIDDYYNEVINLIANSKKLK